MNKTFFTSPRARLRRLITNLVIVSLLAGIVALPGGALAAEKTVAPATPVKFEPGRINRVPVGAPIPATAEEQDMKMDLGEKTVGEEIPERRTEQSKTRVGENGLLETQFFNVPVNFQDAKGVWQKIDNTLVPSSEPGKALRNAANKIKVALPSVIGEGSASVESESKSVEMTLISAQGPNPGELASPPLNAGDAGVGGNSPTATASDTPLPSQQSEAIDLLPNKDAPAAEVESSKATYSGVFPGVDVAYTALNTGLKEDLVLHSADVPTNYDFNVELSSGLQAEQLPTGGITLKDSTGKQWGELARPFVHDASFPGPNPTEGVSFEAVTMSIVATSPQLIVRVSVDPAWLKADRKFPATLDPSMLVGSSNYTFITSATPTTNYDNHGLTLVYGSPTPYRVLAKPIPDLANFFKEPVEIISAEMILTTIVDTTGFTPLPVGVYEITSDWSSSQATWNNRKSGVAWGSAGGDLASQPESVLANINGPSGVQRRWSIMSMVKAWVKAERPYNGAMVKYVNDAQVAPPVYFDGANALFSIAWMPQLGLHSPFTFESFQLGERRQALVNVVSGSVKLTETDLSLAGTGLDAMVERGYDSRAGTITSTSMGSFWTMWPGGKERLFPQANGDVFWLGGPERELLFEWLADGTYRSPQGYRGHLSKLGNGTYTVTMHDTGLVFEFGASNQISKIKDRNGNTITFNYQYDGPSGLYVLSSLTDTKGRVTTFSRSSPSQVTRVTDPSGRQHNYGYTNEQLTSYTDPTGKITRYEYQVPGIFSPLTKIIDPNLNETRFGYASASVLYPPNSGVSDWSYRLTSLTRVTDPASGAGFTWNFEYSQNSTKVIDPNGKSTTYTFDKLGRVTEVLDALGKTVKASYTSAGFVKDQTDQAGAKTTLSYSADGRDNLTSLQSPTGASQTTSYHPTHVFYPLKSTNTQGNSVTFDYSSVGNRNMAKNELPTQNELTATYNANGTVATTKDGVGNISTFDYYPNGDLQRINKPLGVGNQSFEYDGLSRLTKVTDAKGQATTFGYDALDRVTLTGFAGGSSIVNVYDYGGRLTRTDDKSGPGPLDPVQTTTFGYDRLNRQTTKVVGGLLDSVTFTSVFDGVGNLKSISDTAVGTVNYEYNGVNLLSALIEPGGARTTFEYDGAYRRNKIIYPNGVNQTTVYDPDGKVTSIVGRKADGTVLTTFGYGYVKPGTTNQTQMVYEMTDSSGTTQYKYDQMERMTEAATPGGTFNFTFDGNANRLRSSINGTAETFYAVNAADQLCHTASAQAACGSAPLGAGTYQYDLNGNLSGQSDGRVLTHNSKDQTTSFTPGGLLPQTTNMSYLGAGQTERTTAGGLTFKNGPLGLAINSSGLLSSTNYVRTPEGELVSLRNGSVAHYYLFDRLGSVVAITDSTGNAVNRYFYDPYGNYLVGTTEAVANPWQYAGGFKDAFSGYYKFGARYYDPMIGRWTQPDPSRMDANSYAYAGSNPVNFVDTTGLKINWKRVFSVSLGVIGTALTVAAIAGSGGTGFIVVSLLYGAVNTGYQCKNYGFRSRNCALAAGSAVLSGAGTAVQQLAVAKELSGDLVSLQAGAATALGYAGGVAGNYACAVDQKC